MNQIHSSTQARKRTKPAGVSRKALDFNIKYKTELCWRWENGNCPFGKQCGFAHGREELRLKLYLPKNYRTKQCKQFFDTGFCNYGTRCQFSHTLQQDSTAPNTPESSPSRSRQTSARRRLPIFIQLEQTACDN